MEISQLIEQLITNYGLIAIFFCMLLNGFISAPPSEPTLALAGALAVTPNYTLYQTLGVAILGNFLGTYILYLIGRKSGYKWIIKIGPTKETTIQAITIEFKKSGTKWLGIFRCLPIIRSIISLPAGIAKISHTTFSLYSLAGITVWALAWQLIGFFLGKNWHIIGSKISIALIVILLIGLLYFKKKIERFIKTYANKNTSILEKTP